MLKYVETAVTFSEIPDEITLCINISNCPCHCKGCHSSYLAEDIGIPLVWWVEYSNEEHSVDTCIENILDKNKGITCICLMGGDSDPKLINALASEIRTLANIKIAWYSGRQELSKDIDLKNFDYIKLGPYIEEYGPLNSKTTNQRLYKVEDETLKDITHKFWKE
jgi:anaerobic ribonucleoside-triphosphate reductase activating protein